MTEHKNGSSGWNWHQKFCVSVISLVLTLILIFVVVLFHGNIKKPGSSTELTALSIVMDLSEAVVVNSGRLKSVVWNDFDRIKKGDTCLAICRHCKKKLSGSSTSGTSHLRNHLIRCQRRSGNSINQYVTPREKKKKVVTLALTNFSVDHGQKKEDVLVKFEQDQMRDDPINTMVHNFDQRRSYFDLARMIILHGYPLTMVEHVGFRVFVKNLQPLFELGTFNRVEADCMEIYIKEKQKVSELLDKLPGKISISIDKWATSGHDEFLCLAAHFIDESWQLNKKVLSFILVDPSHTEEMHSEAIMSSLMDWDIDRKLFSMTFDTCSSSDNISSKIKDRMSQNRFLFFDGRLFDVRCAINMLNTMAQNALEVLWKFVPIIRGSIHYVKMSLENQAKFNELASDKKVQSQKGLSLDNPLQWSSTYLMLAVALEYREAFTLLQANDPNYTLCPSNDEWETLNSVTSCLKFFFEVTNGLTRSKNPTANNFFPELCDVHLQLIEWSKKSDDCISSLATIMRNKFEKYWGKCSLGLAVATMLDPRFKMKLVEYYYPQIYGNGAQEYINEVFDCVKALYNEHSICSPLAVSDDGIAWEVGGKDTRDRLIGFDKYLHETSLGEAMKSDLDKYLEEPLFPRTVDFNALNWWKVHTPRYPILSMMARNVLGIPMAKTAHDSAFNLRGRVLDEEWTSLNPATIQAVVCSQDWIRSELES